ncbi:MAG: ZIP family metal transporter, partial [Thermoplasmata archaeon]|nr:ZIP family metal transporter [Thermoplasmata archaeon]
MDAFAWIILATVAISLLSLVGVFTLMISDKLLNKIILGLVGLSAGTLMGGAFLHLIPEAIHDLDHDTAFMLVIVGFMVFFIL